VHGGATRGERLRLDAVVPALDEERNLAALAARLLRASDPGDRVERLIVADGGSTDRTREIAAECGATVVASARGRGVQLAAGARAASGDVLVFLHADALPESGALARVREHLRDAACTWGAFEQRIDAEGWFYRCVERAANARVRRGMVYGDSGLVVRRELYERAGGFREMPLFEDVELSQRLRRLAPARLFGGARLAISARRWQRHGALRVTLRNWMLRLAYGAGVEAATLARFYPSHRERGPAR
jgi:rSAM/selenodomain-associated transferase 2